MPVFLTRALLETLHAHAAQAAPDECVGLLFGHGERVTRVQPLENASSTPRTRFYALPQALFAALREADDRGETLLGSYHSHPESAAWPSETDLEAPDGTVQVIIGQDAVRAFRLSGGVATELGLRPE